MDDAERQSTCVFEGFRLDAQRRTLTAPDGRPVPLPPKTLDTLCHLVARAGEVVGKRELLESIWPHVVVEENNLNQAISQLRRALGERPEEHRFIVTEPGRGYRFVARVRTDTGADAGEVASNRSQALDEPSVLPTERPKRRKRPAAGLFAAAVAVVAAAIGVAWHLGSGGDARLPNSIAVLPFENLSPDPANAFFAAGLHGEILSQLAKIAALNVIGQTSMRGFAESPRTPQEIAAELNVGTVLHATVEYANGRVRIRPQLIAGETGRTLWAESYDRDFEDIFAIQSEIAAEVANALRAEFSVAERSAVATPPTTSPAAYTAYLQAQALGNLAGDLAMEYLEEATRLDPRFALAYAAQAVGLANRLNASIGQEAADPSQWQELERRIRLAAGEALRLDPGLWLAHTALGNLHERRWRWTEALAEYDLAARTSPPGVRRVNELTPFVRGLDFAPSIRDQREVVALNPGVAGELWVLGLMHAYARNPEAAVAAFREAVSLAPGNPIYHIWLAHAEASLGRPDEALRELRRAEQNPVVYESSISMVNLAYAYAQSGSAEDAGRWVDLFAARATDRRHHAGHWALAHLAVGDVAAARAALETVVDKIANEEPDAGYLTLRLIRTNIYGDPALDEPAFVALREQLRGR